MLGNKEFYEKCKGAAGMLSALAEQAADAGDGPVKFDPEAAPQTIEVLADLIVDIAKTAQIK